MDKNSIQCGGEQKCINCLQKLSWVNGFTSTWIILSLTYLNFPQITQTSISLALSQR
jgi:hypothetical protein